MEIEHFFSCPYCWEEISFVLDASLEGQSYIEDCEVCCQPIEIRYRVEDHGIVDFEANGIEQ
ncbi:MAG: CPXCG motif-containing cysteine-rich protein [Pyrinomonadaceae bacterium]